ncbi:MAG: hypothetical protein JNJ45_10435 [Chthonomonas sp.]|nr:hypothetical protein [Chthonomonas sp.]
MKQLPPGWVVTGFGPFGDVTENPSGILAQALSPDAVVLPVTYAAVDQFLADLSPTECLLMIGVDATAKEQHLELIGHNQVTGLVDVDGQARRGSIVPDAPARLGSTLVPAELATTLAEGNTRGLRLRTDPGRYLCNYALFCALARRPEIKSAFLHIPPFEVMSKSRQVRRARWIVEECHRAWYL